MLGARFANKNGEVDQARSYDITAAIDDAHAFGQHIGADRLANAGDHPIGHKHTAARLSQRSRIDETRINQGQRRVGHGA
jgi:hypothetical protein